jgi:hypothetical protein
MSSKALSTTCPYCAGAMRPAVMECPVCGVEVRGRFRQAIFQMLDSDDQELLEAYLLAGFSIKDLAARSGMGYAAIRTRLDRLIARYQELRQADAEKKKILERLAAGEINAQEAARLIAKL